MTSTTRRLTGTHAGVLGLIAALSLLVPSRAAVASTAYGSLNNFDCVNDTGVEAHGFEIELDDVRSTDITYTYDYNHYGIPRIIEDNSDPAHPRVFVRYAATRNPDGTWSAFTAIPSGPITPTDGHQFTNPSVNFGGEHFGVGYYGTPTAVKYNWLVDDGAGNLVHGPPVYVATPTFTYFPPLPAQPVPQVQAVIVPPPPPDPPVRQFGEPTWVRDIKTTTHNPEKVALRDLVDPDPDHPDAKNWANGEPAEVETEWRILQTEFANPDNPKGELAGVPQELPGGDEIITRRYEFYKYVGPLDAESGEAMADAVAADGIHGVGSVTYNDHIDPQTGEWVTVTVDLSTVVVVGEFFGAQMAGFDVAPALGLVDHLPDGELGVRYADRRVVIGGGAPFLAALTSGAPPDGTALDVVTGILSGTPTLPGVFTFSVDVSDATGAALSKTYTITIPGDVSTTYTVATSASPAAGGTTEGGGSYQSGSAATVIASHNPGYAFVNWTENDVQQSVSAVYPFTVNANRALVAHFARITYVIGTAASPGAGGTTSGGGTVNHGDTVTVVAAPNIGYRFVNWTEGGGAVSASASYSFTATTARTLVANFERISYTIVTSASPAAGGTTGGDITAPYGDSVTVTAAANAGYHFVNWIEGGATVSESASYTFTIGANRTLVASFALNTPNLELRSASAVRRGSKVDVTMTIGNSGTASAGAVAINAKKDVTLDGKGTNERPPIVLGTIEPGAAADAVLTFSGVKAGVHSIQVRLTFSGGSATLLTSVSVP